MRTTASTVPQRQRCGDRDGEIGHSAFVYASTVPQRQRCGDLGRSPPNRSPGQASTVPQRQRCGDQTLGKGGTPPRHPCFNSAAAATLRRLDYPATEVEPSPGFNSAAAATLRRSTSPPRASADCSPLQQCRSGNAAEMAPRNLTDPRRARLQQCRSGNAAEIRRRGVGSASTTKLQQCRSGNAAEITTPRTAAGLTTCFNSAAAATLRRWRERFALCGCHAASTVPQRQRCGDEQVRVVLLHQGLLQQCRSGNAAEMARFRSAGRSSR